MDESMANQSQIDAGTGSDGQVAAQAAQQEPGAHGTEGTQVAAQATSQAGQEPEVFEVKHNKETVRLTRDELLQAASKGLDYDRIRPTYDFMKQQAQTAGVQDVSQYVTNLQTQMGQLNHQKRVQEYVAEGMIPEQAERQAALEESLASVNDRLKAQDVQAQHEREMKQIVTEFPDVVKDGKLPDAVAAIVKDRDDVSPSEIRRLLMLYKAQTAVIDGFKAKDSAAQANAAGAAASTGSMASAPAAEKDFYTSAEWDTLPAETKRKLIQSGKIYDFMKKWGKK